MTVNGRTWSWTGKSTVGGKEDSVKGQVAVAPDLMSYTETFEISAEGKAWIPFFEYKYTKVKPAKKK